MRRGEGVVAVGPRRIPVRAERVTDPFENGRVSDGIERKYERPAASVRAMIREEVLATTAKLAPA
jgi:hypothetical protein